MGMQDQLGLYEKAMPDLPWREKLCAARRAGFDYLEISIDETDAKLARLNWSAAERNALCQAIQDSGLPIRSLCLSGHRRYPLGASQPALRERGLEIMRLTLDLAVELGVRYIQLAGYDVYYEPSTADTRLWFAENVSRCVEMAARSGVVLAFETMETPFMDTVEKAMQYVERFSSPYLQVYPDIGNLTNAALIYGDSVIADLRRASGHIVAAHLKETTLGVYRDLKFGTGHVDFQACVATLRALGVRRFVAEMWYQGAADWQAELLQAHDLLRRYLNPMPADGG